MANADDTIQQFLADPQQPKSVNYWRQKQGSYLTLSAIIRDQDGPPLCQIKTLQQEVVEELEPPYIAHDPYAQDVECLFKYPEDRFHCSLVNFLTYSNDFDTFVHATRKDDTYQILVGHIIKLVTGSPPPKSNAKIAGLYPGSKKEALIDSFSLQLFPDPQFVQALEKISCRFLSKKDCGEAISRIPDCRRDGKVKGHGERGSIERFPINILRFLHAAGTGEPVKSEQEKIKTKIQSVNQRYNNNKEDDRQCFAISKLVLIESDPFLCRWNKLKEFPLN